MTSSASHHETTEPGTTDGAPQRSPILGPRFTVGLGLLFFFAVTVTGAAVRDLWEPDDGRYAEIAREMVVTGDWLVPRIAGCPFLEKPPLTYYATAVCLWTFGCSAFIARLPSLLAGLVMLLVTHHYARRWFGKETARRSLWLLAACPLLLAMAQTVAPDAWYATLLVTSLFALREASLGNEHASRSRWIGWICLAGAALSKGPLALVLAGGVLLAGRFVGAVPSLWRMIRFGPIACFLALLIPWFYLIGESLPEFWDVYVNHVHLTRAAGDGNRDHHPHFFGYFLLLIIPLALPSALWLPVALKRWISERRSTPNPHADYVHLMWLVPLILHSIPSGKLPNYMLPVLPGIAIACALELGRETRSTPRTVWWRFMQCTLAFALVAAPVSTFFNDLFSPVPLARELEATLRDDDGIACHRKSFPSVMFTLQRPVRFYVNRGDFHYSTLENVPETPLVSGSDAIVELLDSAQRWYVFTTEKRRQDLLELVDAESVASRGSFEVFLVQGQGTQGSKAP